LDTKEGEMSVREEAERVLRIQEGKEAPENDFERLCYEFYKDLKERIKNPYFFWDKWLKENFEKIITLSSSDEPILLLGETGSGKEIVARFIHFISKRKEKKFYPINCSSQSEDLLLSELFGHEKGAFTGAEKRWIGRLRSSDGGTVFLDEIQSSSLKFQTSLLRFLDYGEIQPLGTERIERADVRVISASSLSLSELKMILYEPFFWRISGLYLSIPPFRERVDRESYIYYFLLKECKIAGKELDIEEKGIEAILDYPWEGNLRELRSFIHKIILERKRIRREDILDEIKALEGRRVVYTHEVNDEDLNLENAIRRHIEKVLKMADGNRSKAAKLLGIPVTTLISKMKKLKIE
jgi:transcriptional regulator with PAS, ATPase and Fis domain